jgi:magnesium transporter
MDGQHLLQEIKDHLDAVIAQDSILGKALWSKFLELHPADIADFFTDIAWNQFQDLFLKLPKRLQMEVFKELSDVMKVNSLAFMNEQERVDALNILPVDELTDLFDLFSDEELKVYLVLLNKKAREKVLSLLKFDPESAGGIMDTEVLVLMQDFTVEKSIQVLQRLQPNRDIYQQIYIIDKDHHLVGHIKLEDLVLQNAQTRIQSFMRHNELVALAQEDRETIAKKMVHYGLMTVPVVGDDGHFLGVISSETLVDVLVEEASEDVQKMSALAPLKYPYFETPFMRLLFERGYILVALLLAQSFSTTIMKSYHATLSCGALLYFTTMLISTGGNTSNQTSALVIQGLITGELHRWNIFKFLRREFCMSIILAAIIAFVSFVRAYVSSATLIESMAIGCSSGAIVIVAVMLGAIIPLVLKRLSIDPAFSAGPFLATLMDILGILIYCYITKLILF